MTPEEKYRKLYEDMYNLCEENEWGDPFSYARGKEIYIATLLDHKVAKTYSGADAFDERGACEYKSTITDKICGTYNGISVQPSLNEQIEYIEKDKIGAYNNHYFARFAGGRVAEIYVMDKKDVINLVLPKVVKQYSSKKFGKAKDPRIGVNITKNEIKRYGKKIYG